jgi:hypothetical protein
MKTLDDDIEFQVLLEACRLAEKNLENEVAIALAADQRATSFAGLIVATIAVLVGLNSNFFENFWLSASIFAFAISAVLSGAAARSVKVHTSGFRFDAFDEDISNKRPIKDILRDIGSYYDEGSKHNRAVIRRNSRFFNLALLLSAFGLVFAIASFALTEAKP